MGGRWSLGDGWQNDSLPKRDAISSSSVQSRAESPRHRRTDVMGDTCGKGCWLEVFREEGFLQTTCATGQITSRGSYLGLRNHLTWKKNYLNWILNWHHVKCNGFPGGSGCKESACNAGGTGLIPGSGRPPGEENGNPLQYSCLENSMHRGAWWATVHGKAW